MKSKAAYSVLFLLVAVLCLLGCGGGGSGSNPAALNGTANAKVSGVIINSLGEPVANVSVRLVLANRALLDSLTSFDSEVSASFRPAFSKRASDNNTVTTEFIGLTDTFGSYEFNNVPHGLYTLSANTADGAQVVVNFSVRGSEARVPEVILKPTGIISGTVKKNGIPVAAAIIYLDGTSYGTITSSQGEYNLSGVPIETDFKLAVASNEGSFTPIDIKIQSDGRSLIKDLSLAPASEKHCSVSLSLTSLESLKSEYSKCFFLAISDESSGFVTFANAEGKAVLKISKPGDYAIIPAYRGYNIANAAFGGLNNRLTVTEEDIQTGKNSSFSFNFGGIPTGSSSIKGIVEANSGVFEVVIYGKSGIQRRKTLTANSAFVFSNLPDDEYSIAVFSDTALYIKKGINLSAGALEDMGSVTPVTIAPTYSYSDGNVTFNLQTSPVDSNASGVSYKVSLRPENGSSRDETDLAKIEIESEGELKKNFNAAEVAPVILSTDGCNSGKGYLWVTFSFSADNNSGQKSFEKAYLVAPELSRVKFRTVKLGDLKASNNIVYFKTVEIDTSFYYLVVTASKVYLFNSDGSEKNSTNLPSGIRAGDVKPGNFTLGSDDSSMKLFVQYVKSDERLCISAVDLSSSGLGDFNITYNHTDNFSVGGSYFKEVYSPNKLEFIGYDTAKGWQFISLCDNCIRKISLQISGSTVTTNAANNSAIFFNESLNAMNPTYVLASHSTFISVSDDDPSRRRLYYIACGDSSDNYKSYIGTIDIDSELGGLDSEKLTPLAVKPFDYDDRELGTVLRKDANGCFCYRLYTCVRRTGDSPFPFAIIADKDDNAQAEAIILDGSYNSNYDSETALAQTQFIQTSYSISPTRYLSFSGVKDFGAGAIYSIERNSYGHYIKVKSTETMELLQKIEINPVVNSFTFLEDSIEYTRKNGFSKVHCLTMADDDNKSIQVVVFNNIVSRGN